MNIPTSRDNHLTYTASIALELCVGGISSFRTNVAAKKMVIHQAKTVGNLDADRGCRTQLIGEVRGDIGKLFTHWDLFGWHRVTLYGDVKEPLVELDKALGLEVVEEA